jgi:hypothetical protein
VAWLATLVEGLPGGHPVQHLFTVSLSFRLVIYRTTHVLLLSEPSVWLMSVHGIQHAPDSGKSIGSQCYKLCCALGLELLMTRSCFWGPCAGESRSLRVSHVLFMLANKRDFMIGDVMPRHTDCL